VATLTLRTVETVSEWKDEYHERINQALKTMGGSFDWTREAFTMDENLYVIHSCTDCMC
jgi:valyl-tRNA synthetase